MHVQEGRSLPSQRAAAQRGVTHRTHVLLFFPLCFSFFSLFRSPSRAAAYLDLLLEVRERELKLIHAQQMLNVGTTLMWTATPVLISLVAFITLGLTADNFNPAQVFAALALFNVLRMPLIMGQKKRATHWRGATVDVGPGSVAVAVGLSGLGVDTAVAQRRAQWKRERSGDSRTHCHAHGGPLYDDA